jgi:hypothetical protein
MAINRLKNLLFQIQKLQFKKLHETFQKFQKLK